MQAFQLAGMLAAVVVPALMLGFALRRYSTHRAAARLFLAAVVLWLVCTVSIDALWWSDFVPVFRSVLTGRWLTHPFAAKALGFIATDPRFAYAYWTTTALLLVTAARKQSGKLLCWRITVILPLSVAGLLLGQQIDSIGPMIFPVEIEGVFGKQIGLILMGRKSLLGFGPLLFWCIWYAGVFGGKPVSTGESSVTSL